MIQLAKRNILLYLRDRPAVFFSMLGVFMILLLYMLFLADNMTSSFGSMPDAKLFVSTWLIAGICSISPVTSCLTAAGTLVDDRTNKISRDFFSSPLSRYQLTGGYFLGALTSSFLITFFTLFVGFVWLFMQGYPVPTPSLLAQIIGLQILVILSGSILSFFMVTFFRTSSSLGAATTLVGSSIGFFTGMYLPIGDLPEAMQWIVRIFPVSHSASLLRNAMLSPVTATVFKDVPASIQNDVLLALGVEYKFGSIIFPQWGSILILTILSLLFFGFSVLRLSKKETC